MSLITNIPQTITNAKDLETVLLQLVVPDSEVIQNAEKVLKKFTQHQQCLAAFMQQIQSSSHFSVKQAAGVLMRSKIKAHWESIEHSGKEYIKKSLLECLVKEVDPRVRSAVVEVIAEIARFELPKNQWSELAPFLMQCVKNTEAAYREVGMYMFSSLIETVREPMKNNLSQLMGVLQAGLTDDNMSVRMGALKAVQALVNTIIGEREVHAIIPLIPFIITVIRQSIAAHQDNVAISAFEIFDGLVETKTSQAFDSVIPSLMQFMIEIAVNAELDVEIRDRAVTFISWVIAFKPNIIIKQKMISAVINVAFKMLCEPEDDDTEDDEQTGSKIGASLLDELAVGIPSKHIFREVIEKAVPLTNSANYADRKAAVTAIGLISEGCHQPMRGNLGQAVPIIVKACSDQSKQVRAAAYLALAAFSEFLKPEINDFHDQIVPPLIVSLDDPSFEVREKSCSALDTLCQNLGDKIVPMMQPIMSKLIGLLTNGDRKTQEIVIPVISAVALAVQSQFLPFMNVVLPLMKQLMDQKSGDLLLLRGHATECVGITALAVGKAHFAPFVDGFMRMVVNTVQQEENAEMKEYAYRFFENISTALAEDFSVFLPTVVPFLMQTIINDAVLQKVPRKTSFSFDDEDDEDDDFTGEELDTAQYSYTVRTSQLDERAAAVSALASVAFATKQNFSPYLDQTIQVFLEDATYFHYAVRRHVMKGLKSVMYAAIPTSSKDSNYSYNEQQVNLVNKVMVCYATTMLEDDDKETVAVACESLSELCRDFGRKIIERHVDVLANSLNTLIQQKCPCNQTSLEDEEEGDHDIVLIDAVSDAIDDMARAIGPDFAKQFKYILPEILKYTQPNRDVGDRMMAIGTIAEVSEAIKHAGAPFFNDIFPVVINGIKDNHQDVKRNAVFCAGVLAHHLKQLVEPHIMNILSLLYPIFAQMDKFSNPVIDNACGAIARIIHSQYNIPVDQVLPVFLSALPLREDFEENDIIYSSIISLIQAGHSCAAKHIKEILVLFAKVITLKTTQADVKSKIEFTLKQMRNNYGSQLVQVVSQCDSDTQQVLSALFNN